MDTEQAGLKEKFKIKLLNLAVLVLVFITGTGTSDFSLRIAKNQIDMPSIFGFLNFSPLLVAIVGLILAIVVAAYILLTINEWLIIQGSR